NQISRRAHLYLLMFHEFITLAVNWTIEREVAQYEARELPGFINYKTFEDMVKEQIKLLEGPAVQKLKEVSEIVKKDLHKVAEDSFVGFSNLTNIAKSNIDSIRQEKEVEAEAMLRAQFKMEASVYAQDTTYSKKLGKRKREEEQAYASPLCVLKSTSTGGGATLKEMIRHIQSYYQIAGQRLAEQIPLVIRYQMLQQTAIQLQDEMLQMLQNRRITETMLQEDPHIKSKRIDLQNRLKRLSKARFLLTNYIMNI
uniref:Interferon-induced GTP-binding protein Mx-like n=1 Tax=Labrus bergylta TaxID=56723 RepID=A0A3Q3NHJ7_9LABR